LSSHSVKGGNVNDALEPITIMGPTRRLGEIEIRTNYSNFYTPRTANVRRIDAHTLEVGSQKPLTKYQLLAAVNEFARREAMTPDERAAERRDCRHEYTADPRD
jgi:dTDP-4-dehydrorhamnose reductase